MHRINRETGKNVNLTTEAVEQLQYYSWPGNVFELERFLHELAKQNEGNIADEHQVWQLLNQQSGKPVPAVAPKPAQRAKNAGFAVQGNQARPYLQADSHSLEKIEETLAADALAYQLLLPEDGALAARAEALAAWAQGFTVAVHWLHPALDEDARAFLADLEEIGKLD